MKKAYTPPEIYRVELNADQAILSACSLLTTVPVNGGGQACRSNCKNHSNTRGSDSGARPS